MSSDPEKIKEEMQKEELQRIKLENAERKVNMTKSEAETRKIEQAITNEEIKTTSLEKNVAANQQKAAVAKQKLYLSFWTKIISGIWTVVSSFFSSIAGFFSIIFKDLSPYIALAIVIMVFVGALSTRVGTGGWGYPSYTNRFRSPDVPRPSFEWLQKWFTPGYKIRSLLNYFNGNVKSIRRPIEKYGRCDNVEWQHTGGSGSGLCVRTYAPKDIEWSLGPGKIQDLSKLPKNISDTMTKNGQKLTVYIPWAAQGPFYVPQCSKAYFKVLDSNGNEQQESAAYLLKDNGLTCERVVKESKKYGVMYRPVGSTDLTDFASEKDPKCNA